MESVNSYLEEEDTRSEFSLLEVNCIETTSNSGLNFQAMMEQKLDASLDSQRSENLALRQEYQEEKRRTLVAQNEAENAAKLRAND